MLRVIDLNIFYSELWGNSDDYIVTTVTWSNILIMENHFCLKDPRAAENIFKTHRKS